MTAIAVAGTIPATTVAGTSFSRQVEVGSNSTKNLYVVLDTTFNDGSGDGFATTTSDDLLTATVDAYTFNDGVADFVAADTGYGLTVPVNGNTLRY